MAFKADPEIFTETTRLLFMDEGVIAEQGSPAEIFDHPTHPRTIEFLSKVL